MQASRLIRMARDMLADYEKLGVAQLLQEAAHLSAQRPSLNDAQYTSQAHKLRERAVGIIADTRLAHYPAELREILVRSKYAVALPERLTEK